MRVRDMLSENDVKSELSYAYLHMIATRAGCSVTVASRLLDNTGVDATIHAKGRFAEDAIYTRLAIDVQLKATSAPVSCDDRGRFQFPLPIRNYKMLREENVLAPQIVVVLFLPEDPDLWTTHSEECLIARRCAYWVSLRGAPDVGNSTSKTISVPRTNLFSDEGLKSILRGASRGERIPYVP